MKYLKGFDGLRGVSIMLVLVTHLGFLDQLDFNDYWVQRLLKIISGYTGVNIFFTLSGFLITKILLEERFVTGSINLKNFFARRFLRLAPPILLFYFAAGVLMHFKMITASYFGLLFALFYVFNFVPNKYYTSELGHLWSLAVEEQFYLVWPFVIAFAAKNSRIVIGILILISCLLAPVILNGMSFSYGEKHYGIDENFKLEHWFFPAVAPIIIGSLVYIYSNSVSHILRLMLSYRRLNVIGILLFLSPFLLPDFALDYAYIIQSLGIALILIWLGNNQNSMFSSVLSFYPLAYIGKISYGLYVYHGLFIRTGPGSSLSIQQFPLNLLLTFMVSVLSFEFFEKRILRFKEKFR